MSKYDPLKEHLGLLRLEAWTPTFREIEHVLGFPLPASARVHQAWWANDVHHVHASAWLDAGWRTEGLDLGSQKITFRRSGPATARNSGRASAGLTRAATQPPPHVWDDAVPLECRLGFGWTPIGRVELEAGRLRFPAASQAPGIYRFRIRGRTGEALYIGETENLARRFGFYRSPGPSQQTNVRMNAKFREALDAGAEIAVAIVSGAWIERDGVREPPDFSSKAMRCLFENAAIVAGGGTAVESLNRSMPQETVASEPKARPSGKGF